MDWLSLVSWLKRDKVSPQDIVPSRAIIPMTDPVGVMIILARTNIPFTKTPELGPLYEIPDSKSMDGRFDYGHTNILIEPANLTNHRIMINFLKVGDVVVYRIMAFVGDAPADFSKVHKKYIIHQIVKIDRDKDGRFFRLKGQNNWFRDPDKVRDWEILYLYCGTIT